MNYGNATDFEIEKAVAALWLDCDYWFDEDDKTVYLVGYQTYLGAHGIPDERLERRGDFKPLTNASDAWPIILESEIGMNKLKCEPFWMAINGDNYIRHKNPLRAAMIVYLEINKDKK